VEVEEAARRGAPVEVDVVFIDAAIEMKAERVDAVDEDDRWLALTWVGIDIGRSAKRLEIRGL
jgi:hypothetical protein